MTPGCDSRGRNDVRARVGPSGGRWAAKSGRNHDVSVQDHHRSDGPGPNAARSEGGSQSGLPDLEPHDVPGNAREFSSGLSAGRAAGAAGSQWSRASRPLFGVRYSFVRVISNRWCPQSVVNVSTARAILPEKVNMMVRFLRRPQPGIDRLLSSSSWVKTPASSMVPIHVSHTMGPSTVPGIMSREPD